MNKVTEPEEIGKEATTGQRISFLRRKQKIEQETLAKKLNIKRNALSNYEQDKRAVPLDILVGIAKELKTSTDYLLRLTEVRNQNTDDKKIHKRTGLSDKAIKVLNELKNNENMMATINFLIEQEEVYTNEFGFKLDNEFTEEEQSKAYEEAEQKYYELEEKWNDTHFPILQKINDYLNIRIPNEEVYITNDNIKKEKDFETQLQKVLQTKEKVDIKKLVDTALISDINFKLKHAKNYLERRKKSKK